MTAPAPWSERTDLERLELVRPLLAEKQTYTVIADKVGAASRSSIAGLLTRMRAAGELPPVVKKPAKPRRKPSDKSPSKPGAFSLTAWNARSGVHPNDFKGRAEQRAASPGIAVISSAAAWDPLDGIEPITLMQLTNETCRWPVERDAIDTQQYFCGAPSDFDQTYCDCHAELSIRPRAA